MGLSFTIVAGPLQHIHSQAQFPQDSWPHFTLLNSILPHLGGQFALFISHRNRVAQLYPQALGSLSVVFHDSQGYGGGDSKSPPRPGRPVCYPLTHKIEADRIQNTAPTVPPLFAFVFVAAQARTGQVESHITTDGQLASPPRNKAPIWGPLPDFHHCQTVAGPPMLPPPDQRMGPPPTTAAGPRQRIQSRVWVPRCPRTHSTVSL
jgi:hypothetical protein